VFRVGIIARIILTKGQDLVIEAVGMLPKELRERVRLTVAGDIYPGHEDYAALLRELAGKHCAADQVTFSGWIENSEELLDTLDVLVVATRTGEGFSTIALESLAAGVPVVVASSGGIDELVDDSCGKLATPGEARSICAAIKALMTASPSERLARRHSALQVADRYSLQASADALLSCWDDAAGGAHT
jgi:glycosyltransferase involved in cell wall biosynthesis